MRLIILLMGIFMLIAGIGILTEFGHSFIGVMITLSGIGMIISPLIYDEAGWLE